MRKLPTRWLAAAWCSLGIAGFPSSGFAGLRPIVGEMVQNLSALNEIGRSLALEDFAGIERAAVELDERAKTLKNMDPSETGIPGNRDGQFDAFLDAQIQSARSIRAAARSKDTRAVVLGMQSLTTSACVACHQSFRGSGGAARTSVLFMTVLLGAWNEINRGLMLGDYDTVTRQARQLQSVTQVFTWDQVIEDAFGIKEAEERKRFRGFLRMLTTHASRLEQASLEERADGAIEAVGKLWSEGCLACHEAFRPLD